MRVSMKFFRNIVIGLLLFLSISGVSYLSYPAIGHAVSPPLTRQPLWSVKFDAATAPLVGDRQLFVTQWQRNEAGPLLYSLHALDATSGQRQWSSQRPALRKLLAVEGNTLYASTPEGAMMLDTATGKPKATVKFPRPNIQLDEAAIGVFQSAVISESQEMIDNRDPVKIRFRSEIFAQTPEKTLWKFAPPVGTLIGIAIPHGFVRPLIQDGILFLPMLLDPANQRIQQFAALDAATGKLLWTWKVPDELWSATVLGDTIYASAFGNPTKQQAGWVKAVDLKTGQERWSYPQAGKVKLASDREVFVWQRDGNSKGSQFKVLDLQTGEVLRTLTLAHEYDHEPGGLVLADNRIYAPDLKIENATFGFYASADNHSWINVFDATTGQVVWRTPTLYHSHVYTPVVVGDRLFVASNALNKQAQDVIQMYNLLN